MRFRFVSAIAVCLFSIGMVACGGGTSSTLGSGSATGSATGTWTSTLAASGQQLGSYTFNATQSNTTLTVNGMNFVNLDALAQCFGDGTVMSGQMDANMMGNHSVTMTMSWTLPGTTETNTLTMQGTMAMGMGSASGIFTLTGQTPGCATQTGTFSMTQTGHGMM